MNHLTRRSLLAALSLAGTAHALGRTPFSGVLKLRLPLHLASLDPHVLDDPTSALFAPAICDPLFALDASGKPYPALAAALPERIANGARITLRSELVSARGKALSGADVVFSLKRAGAFGGAAVLSGFRPPSVDAKDPLSVVIAGADPDALARALASPLTAIVPRSFSPLAPDGSGAFAATLGSGTLTLTRNPRAARGAAFLDRIEVSAASDLAECLRAFETGQADVGWLGNGLYRPRAGALALEGPVFGWMVLRSGLDAKAWGAPGIAQQLVSGLPSDALAHFGLHSLPQAADSVRWSGGPTPLLVCDDTPQLVELARALAPLLGSSGNEVSATPVPRKTWQEARRTRHFGLLLDFVRAANTDASQSAQALLAAVDPELAKRPPRNLNSLTDLTRTLTLGVIGELRVFGARLPEFQALDAWQLGSVWFKPGQK